MTPIPPTVMYVSAAGFERETEVLRVFEKKVLRQILGSYLDLKTGRGNTMQNLEIALTDRPYIKKFKENKCVCVCVCGKICMEKTRHIGKDNVT